MANTSLVGGVPDDVFISRAETAAQLAEDAAAAAAAAQAASEQALADTLAALAAQVMDDHADVSSAGAVSGELLVYTGSLWANSALLIDGLGDVVVTAAANDQVLAWNGSAWVNVDPATLSGALPLTGGTMTGPLVLAADPTAALEAATKAYVDNVFAGTVPYDIGAYFDGVPQASEHLFQFTAIRDYWLNQNLPLSRATALFPAAGATTFDIQKNGVSIGSMNFAAAATVATFVFAADVQFNPGDVLAVVDSGTPDATLADISMTFAGQLGIL